MSALVEHRPTGGNRAISRRALLWGAAAGALELALPEGLRAAALGNSVVSGVTVHNGAKPFAGDGPLLTTISPGGVRGRDRAVVQFRLARRATVRLDVVDKNANVTDTHLAEHPALTVATQEHRLRAGAHELEWAPPPGQAPATYTFVLTLTDARGTRTIFGLRGPQHPKRAPGPIVRLMGLDAAFAKRS